MVRKWKYYEQFAHTGDWHVHTSYTDSEMTVSQIMRTAKNLGLAFVVFSEHVAQQLTYSYQELCEATETCREEGLTVVRGAEANILDSAGTLNINEEVLEQCQLVSAAFHTSKTPTKEYLAEAITGALTNWPVDVWAHPAHVTRHLPDHDVIDLLALAVEHGVAIELNLKYRPAEFYSLLIKAGLPFVVGTDAHSVSDMESRWQMWRKWQEKGHLPAHDSEVQG